MTAKEFSADKCANWLELCWRDDPALELIPDLYRVMTWFSDADTVRMRRRTMLEWAGLHDLNLSIHRAALYDAPKMYKATSISFRLRVLGRDRYTCAYCGGFGRTIDHVIPKGGGGARSSVTNAVAACALCNTAKGNRTPEEAGMSLLWRPFPLADVKLNLSDYR